MPLFRRSIRFSAMFALWLGLGHAGCTATAPATSAPTAAAVTPSFVWLGPTWGQTSEALRERFDTPPYLDGPGTPVTIRANKPGRLTVTNVRGKNVAQSDGTTFAARGPVRIRLEFGPDDFFETVLVLPENARGEPIVVDVPDAPSGFLWAGERRIPVSRGVRVVTWRDGDAFREAFPSVDAPLDPETQADVDAAVREPMVPKRIVLVATHTPSLDVAFRVYRARLKAPVLVVGRDGTLYQMGDVAETIRESSDDPDGAGISLAWEQRLENLENLFRPVVLGVRTRADFTALPAKQKEVWRTEVMAALKAFLIASDPELASAPSRFRDAMDEWIGLAFTDPWNGRPESILPEKDPDPNFGITDPDLRHALGPPAEINGTLYRAYGPTPRQTRTMVTVISALLDGFPTIPPTMPTDPDGGRLLMWHAPAAVAQGGIVGLFHLHKRFWSPGPSFPWQAIADLLLVRR